MCANIVQLSLLPNVQLSQFFMYGHDCIVFLKLKVPTVCHDAYMSVLSVGVIRITAYATSSPSFSLVCRTSSRQKLFHWRC